MARNREPVEFESESGDDESSSEEVESQESDSEAEQTQTAAPKKSQPLLPVKSQQTPAPPPLQSEPLSSSEGEESGSETESDSDGPDSNARPLASKPMEEAQKPMNEARRTRSKPNAPEHVTPAKPSAAKRPRPSEDTAASKDGKKPKKSAGPEGSEKKPNFFQRLWSVEDEIFVLKGMMEYSSKNECDIGSISDILDGLYDFIKKSLHMDFSMIQLRDKIKRLKRKYKKNNSKEKKGKEMRFANSHEQSLYELSKEIWGEIWGEEENRSEKVVGSPKANGRKKGDGDVKKAVVGSGEGERVLRVNLNLSGEERMLSFGRSGEERMLSFGREIYEVEQGVEGEEEWSKLRVEEMELYLKQLELRVAQTKLLLNVVKPRSKVLLKVVKSRYH